jgi:RimJ/RimL family protein N-acetyltransferase
VSLGVSLCVMVRTKPADPPAIPLTDGVVTLRLRQASDTEAIVAASRDRETIRWMDDEPLDAEAGRAGVERARQAWCNGTAAPMVIADAATGRPKGLINLQFRSDDVATMAYSVFPDSRGQGIAPRAVQLMTAWALTALRIKQVLLEVKTGNAASIRVAQKGGFNLIEGGDESMVVFAAERRSGPHLDGVAE